MHDEGATSTTKIFANVFISFIGAGILGVPFAFKEAGIAEGAIIMSLVGMLSVKAMLLLIDCKQKLSEKKCKPAVYSNGHIHHKEEKIVNEEREPLTSNGSLVEIDERITFPTKEGEELDYGDLAYYALGNCGKSLVDVSIVVSQIGFCCAYLIFISESLSHVTPFLTKTQFLLAMLPFLVLLTNLRHLKSLAFSSLLADFANVFAYCVVFWFDFEHLDRIKLHPQVTNVPGIPFFLGVSIYCYEGAGMVLALEASCAKDKRDKFRSVFKLTLGLVTVLYITFGACGYLSFGQETKGIITLNLPKGIFPLLVQSCLCFSLFFTYPVMMFPVAAILEKKFLPNGRSTSSSYYQGSALRMCMVAISGIIVVAIPNFSTLMELVGSTCCTLLAFILPAIFHLRIFRGELSVCEKLLDITLITVGSIGTVIGVQDAIQRMWGADPSRVIPTPAPSFQPVASSSTLVF